MQFLPGMGEIFRKICHPVPADTITDGADVGSRDSPSFFSRSSTLRQKNGKYQIHSFFLFCLNSILSGADRQLYREIKRFYFFFFFPPGFIFSFPFIFQLVPGSFFVSFQPCWNSPGLSAQAQGCLEVRWIILDIELFLVFSVLGLGSGQREQGWKTLSVKKNWGKISKFPISELPLGQLEVFSSYPARETLQGIFQLGFIPAFWNFGWLFVVIPTLRNSYP